MAAQLFLVVLQLLIESDEKSCRNNMIHLLKNILMSSASDIQNDPFTQGAGIVNVKML